MTFKPLRRNPVRCAQDPAKWDLVDGQNGYLSDDNKYAYAVCNTVCPLLQACLEQAMKRPPQGCVQAGLIWNTRGKPHTIEQWEHNIHKRAHKPRKTDTMPIDDLTPQQKYDHIYRQLQNLISSADYLDPNDRTYSLMSISDKLSKLSTELFPETKTV